MLSHNYINLCAIEISLLASEPVMQYVCTHHCRYENTSLKNNDSMLDYTINISGIICGCMWKYRYV